MSEVPLYLRVADMIEPHNLEDEPPPSTNRRIRFVPESVSSDIVIWHRTVRGFDTDPPISALMSAPL